MEGLINLKLELRLVHTAITIQEDNIKPLSNCSMKLLANLLLKFPLTQNQGVGKYTQKGPPSEINNNNFGGSIKSKIQNFSEINMHMYIAYLLLALWTAGY